MVGLSNGGVAAVEHKGPALVNGHVNGHKKPAPLSKFSDSSLHAVTSAPGMDELATYTDGIVKEQPFGSPARKRPLRVVCIGAGAAGIYVGIMLPRTFGKEQVDLQVYEKNTGWGGTWFENVYPGVQCDVPAAVYSYSFEPSPTWSNFYAAGAEIQQYFARTAEKYHVGDYVKFEHKVTAAHWDEAGLWRLKVQQADGTVFDDTAHVLINASGILNSWKWPGIEGIETFQGPKTHSAKWDDSIVFGDKTRIGVIGNGSSAIQIVPQLQPRVKSLVTFIRTKTWIALPFTNTQVAQRAKSAGAEDELKALYDPKTANPRYTDEEKELWSRDNEALRRYRHALEHENAARFVVSTRKDSPGAIEAIPKLTAIMKARLARRPELADALIPSWHVGCRRLTPGAGYLEALCEDNVEVVREPIERVVPNGIKTKDGKVHEFDVLVCATGFDVSTRPHFDLVARDGFTFTDEWAKRPQAYMTHSFAHCPNYFIFNGPNAPIANGSLIPAMEAAGDLMAKMIRKMLDEDLRSFCVKQSMEDAFTQYVDSWMPRSIWTSGCRSWYKGGTVDGRVSGVWPGSVAHFLKVIQSPRWEDYDYTYMNERAPFAFMGNGYADVDVDPKADKAWYLHGRHFTEEIKVR